MEIGQHTVEATQRVVLEFCHQAQNPEWEATRHLPVWKDYIPDDVCAIWGTLSLTARCCLVAVGDRMAQEDYDPELD